MVRIHSPRLPRSDNRVGEARRETEETTYLGQAAIENLGSRNRLLLRSLFCFLPWWPSPSRNASPISARLASPMGVPSRQSSFRTAAVTGRSTCGDLVGHNG